MNDIIAYLIKELLMKKLLMIFLFLPSICLSANWECINRAVTNCNTWRMSVIGGWIVASDNSSTGGEHGYAMVFVPDPVHLWKE